MASRSTAATRQSVDPSLSKGMLDGRTLVARRRRELIDVYAKALGGSAALSAEQLVDIRKAAELTALAEQARVRAMRDGVTDAGEISAMVRLEGMSARAVKALRLPTAIGVAKPKSLAEHIAERAKAAGGQSGGSP